MLAWSSDTFKVVETKHSSLIPFVHRVVNLNLTDSYWHGWKLMVACTDSFSLHHGDSSDTTSYHKFNGSN